MAQTAEVGRITPLPAPKSIGIADRDHFDRDETRAPEDIGATAPVPPQPLDHGRSIRNEYSPSVARKIEQPEETSDAAQLRDASQNAARNAWIAFKDACESEDPDRQEASYLAARSVLDDLWGFAKYRDAPFRDLLSILTAAIKHTPFEKFDGTQRDVLRNAFRELTRWLIDYNAVMGHIEKFAEYDIDITGPIRKAGAKKFKITVEEVE